ncbi:MAG: NUDIX hydrolase [Pseudoflavonifractor sp.]
MYADEICAYVPKDRQEETDRRIFLDYIRQYPNTVLTRENECAHLTSSGFVVNADATKVLMAHHNIYKVWAWTGGHADGDGDLLAVALREAREETGIERIRPLSEGIAALDILPVWGHVKRGNYVAAHQHLNVSYLLVADETDPLRPCAGENTKVAWLPADRLLEYTNEWQMDHVYRKLLDRARGALGINN